jgi:hypothetical protein
MNGMAAKKLRRDQSKRFTSDGLPRDVKDWTEDDWRDLHECIERIKQRVAQRHAAEREVAK